MLIPLECLMVVFHMDEDQVLELVENYTLWPCWNIASREDMRRREIRAWIRSAIHVDRQIENCAEKLTALTGWSLDAAIADVLPSRAPDIRGTELARRWTCGTDLIGYLIEGGELAVSSPTARAKESPRLTYGSTAAFLNRRVLR